MLAPCFRQIVSGCECKQRASNWPADGDKRKNKFETSSSNFDGIFIEGEATLILHVLVAHKRKTEGDPCKIELGTGV